MLGTSDYVSLCLKELEICWGGVVNSGPPKGTAMYPVSVTSLGKRVFADILNLRILRRDHAGLSKWVLNPMPSVLVRDTQRRNIKGSSRGDRGRGWTEPLEAERGKEVFSPRDSGGNMALPTL